MNQSASSNSQLSLTPLGAGDLIDRAVRFYRNNFWTFVWIAAPPIVAGTIISIAWTMLSRILLAGGSANTEAVTFRVIFAWLGGFLIWLIESIAVLTVMGGASRNFVRHLLFGEPITFRETYRNVLERLFGLIAASATLSILLGFSGLIIVYLGFIVGFLAVLATIGVLSFSPFLTFIVSLVLSLLVAFGTGWLVFLIASRFAYVPQIMLVEGLGVFAALGRSINLASGNVKRFAALFVFTTAATYSALSLLYIPLGWYAYLNGVEIFTFGTQTVPAWYEIAGQFIWQASFILLMPVWMIGLCLLYVDERVRHEGYDLELMAARRLGDIPAVPDQFINPLQPALGQQNLTTQAAKKSKMTTLGLN